MWIIQSDTLMELPDDVPLPPNSKKIEVPDDLFTSPRDFRVEKGALVTDSKPLSPSVPQFTFDEIAHLKQFVATAAIKAGEGKENK